MKTILATCLLASGLCACGEVGQSLKTNVPVMLGPVTQIGGKPTVSKSGGNDKLEFDPDVETALWICWGSGYPTISRTDPNVGALTAKIGAANSELAGKIPLRTTTARLEEIPVGAYMWFGGGCYGHAWWWTGEGRVEAP